MAKEEGTSFMSKINYGWQTFSLLTPIFMLLNILLQSAINKNIQGVVVFSVIIFAVIVNELLTSFKYLNGVIPEERSSTCGVLNLNRNYFMMNSTIILSFVLAFYGFNMFLYKKLNIIFLVVLSVFLFMDIVYYVLICSKGINIFKSKPPIAVTFPCKSISPVIATVFFILISFNKLYNVTVIAVPAEGPSFGTAPSGQ